MKPALGTIIQAPGWGRHHAGYPARVLGYGKGTLLILWLGGPLAGREARIAR